MLSPEHEDVIHAADIAAMMAIDPDASRRVNLRRQCGSSSELDKLCTSEAPAALIRSASARKELPNSRDQ